MTFLRTKKDLHIDWNDFTIVSEYQQPTDLMNEILTSETCSKRDLLYNWKNHDLINTYAQAVKESDEIFDSKKLKWKINDHCRAICEDDGEYYEALILSTPIGDKTKVYFLGFKKEQEVSVKDLQRSLGKIGRDLELKTISTGKVQFSNTWSKNDICCAKYKGNGKFHEAEIVKLLPDGMCTVFFSEFNETQDVLRANLQSSKRTNIKKKSPKQLSNHGYSFAMHDKKDKDFQSNIKKIRDITKFETNSRSSKKLSQQLSNHGYSCAMHDKEDKDYQSNIKKIKDITKFETNSRSSKKLSQQWSKGDYCGALYDKDGKIYEAKILKIKPDGWCTVLYMGYNEQQDVLIKDLQRGSTNKKHANNMTAVPKRATSVTEKWSKGDYCGALYDKDGKIYEAKILKIKPDGWCTVLYMGYNEQQDVLIKDLHRGFNNKKHPNNTTVVPKKATSITEKYPLMPSVNPHSEKVLQKMFMQWYMSGYFTGLKQAKKCLHCHSCQN